MSATGRADWMGWVELRKGLLSDEATENTGRVIADVGADVQAIVEIESRAALRTLAKDVIKAPANQRYEHAREMEGNDLRGINVGLLSRKGWEIDDLRTHVDDADEKGHAIFSRDCAEHTVLSGSGANIVILVNHFKSQIGSKEQNDAKRKRQSARVAEICARLAGEGHENVAVVGDLNATPDSDSLQPLLSTGLRDITESSEFDDGRSDEASAGDGRLTGTYDEGRKQFDYILLSPALFDRLQRAGIYRKGTWTKTGAWAMYESMQPEHGGGIENAASDHALVYADLDL
ncbi:MAG: endonuclease/exonuclease/phosphatase family protein [Solirubrobacteraceae bacterium]